MITLNNIAFALFSESMRIFLVTRLKFYSFKVIVLPASQMENILTKSLDLFFLVFFLQ